ncbi:GlxA family transcriptional regulator [Nocardia bhagyanarayanae]|uniref:Transcriptional regulator GlxA family with amidase domain n=1 Tax=Nocardia bhagyanarayanae TaxID=1215925 RepID=A0A543FG71_9NOCA|nr:DJ-1/PfpI family protein [Nocardia bhagyanarayanae]TQM32858.1 transcriptional regulator GlxA family with amidase domain [Nocardia bhagyanarayanae]
MRSVAVIGYDGAELLDIACVTSTLDGANRLGADPAYSVHLVTPGGRAITCDSGLRLAGERSLERSTGPLDTLVVSGGLGHRRAAANQRLVAHVRRLAAVSRRVSSVCTGASVLAAAGLLDGKRATTHWIAADQLAAAHPAVTVDPDPIYIRDGHIATAAGMTSALDLMLAFIEEDHDAELARHVARGLVTYLQRPGNQAQMSMFTAEPMAEHALVRRVATHIAANLSGDLSTAALAAREGTSARHLTRLFVEHAGVTPGRYVRRARVEAAAHLLASTDAPIAAVAARCGFGSAETLRQSFVRRYGVPPAHYRATAVRNRRAERVSG